MTVPLTPLGYTDYNSMWGINSDLANQEWDTMLQRRAQLVDSIQSRLAIRSQLPVGMPPAEAEHVADNLHNRAQVAPSATDDPNYRDKLYGAAQFYDIPNYDKLPLSALANIVEQRRVAMKPTSDTPNDVWEQAGLGGASTILGTLQGAIGLARRLPLIGKAIGDNAVTQAIYRKTAEFQEGITADLTDEDKLGLDAANFVGREAAPAIMAWQLGGAIMGRGLGMATLESWAPATTMGWATQAMGRAALSGIQGGITGALLQLDKNPTDKDLAKSIGFGSAFGAVSELAAGVAGRIFQGRLSRSFTTPFDQQTPNRLLGAGQAAEAEGGFNPAGYLPGGPTAPMVPSAPAMPGRGLTLTGEVSDGMPLLRGEVAPPTMPRLGPGLPSVTPLGPVGSTGLVPPERGLPAPYAASTTPAPSNLDMGLYDHYSNMARANVNNPELAASLQQIASEFAPQAQSVAERFDPRSIMNDYDMGQWMQNRSVTAPAAPEPSFDQQINQMIGGLNDVKAGKGGGGVTEPQAVSAATNLTKRATIAESPAILDMARQPRFDDSDVATAAMISNPGGIQILQGVGNEAQTVMQLTRAQIEGKLMPHTFRSVTMMVPNEVGELIPRTDMLISDGLPITNKRVAQYKETGMFEGMRATLPGGSDVVVMSPAKAGGFATVRARNSTLEMAVPATDLLPGKTTDVMPEDIELKDAPALYNQLRNMVMMENSNSAAQAGIPQFGWLDDPATDLLPQQVEGFLDMHGITNPVARAAMTNYIGVQRIKDFQATSPMEMEAMRSMNAQASVRISESRMLNAAPQSLDSMAGAKGLRWENYEGTAGGTLRNIYSQEDYPMAHEEAAREFIKNYNFEQPDLTPDTAVPMEVMENVPGDNHPGDTEDPNAYAVQHAAAYDHLAAIAETESFLMDPVTGMSPEDILAASADPEPPAEIPSTAVVPAGGGGPLARTPPGLPPVPPQPPSGRVSPYSDQPPPIPPSSRSSSLAREFRSADQGQLWKASNRLEDIWVRKGMTMRGVFLEQQQMLENAGIRSNELWSDYGDIVNAKTQAHNDAEPFHREVNDLANVFPSRLKRGTVLKIGEIVDDNERIAAMVRAGYTPKMMAAQRQAADLYDRMFAYTGLKPSRYIPGYMSRVRSAAGRGALDPWGEAQSSLPKELQFFAEYAREGGLNAREMDFEVVMHTYVRAMTNERYMAEPYARMMAKWSEPGIPESYKNLVMDWLKVVRVGYDPSWSYSIQGARSMLNKFGVPVTDHDMSRLWSIGLSGMYRNFLGRPQALFRDSIQPLMAGARIGMTPVVQAYKDFIKSPTARREMVARAYEGGWAEKGMVPTANSDLFRNDVQPQYEVQQFGQVGTAIRGAASGAMDAVRDASPEFLRSGLQGTKIDPSRAYGKLGEFNRIISGQAGWQTATDAIKDYRMNGGTIDQLMSKSKAAVWSRPIRDKFRTLVEQGRDTDAANVLAHEAANTQFRYGAAEGAMDMRTHDGRLGMTLGNFTTQQIQYMREGLSNGSVADRVAFAGRYGAVEAALKLATAYTGWKFSKWAWHTAFGWAGSPMVDAAVSGYEMVKGRRPVPNLGDAAGGLLNAVNPYGGIGGVAATAYEQTQGANPSESFFRYLVTGESGYRSDVEQFFQNMAVDPSTGSRVSTPIVLPGHPGAVPFPPAAPQPGGGAQY